MYLRTQQANLIAEVDDDFMSNGGNEGWTLTVSGGTINNNLVTDANHPGNNTFSYVSANTDRAQLGGPSNSILLGGGTWFIQGLIQVITLSNSTDEYSLYFGLFDAVTATPVDGAYFFYDRATTTSNVWRIATANNSTITVNSLANAVSAGAWIRLGIEINAAASRVKYFIDGVLVGTITSNIPTGAGRTTGFATGYNKSAGTGAADAFAIDHLLIQHQRTNPAWTI